MQQSNMSFQKQYPPLDNLQTSLWAIIIGNIVLSTEEAHPMEIVDSELCGLSQVTGTLQLSFSNVIF